MNLVLLGFIIIVVGVGGCVGYFYFLNLFLDKVLFLVKGFEVGCNINCVNMV